MNIVFLIIPRFYKWPPFYKREFNFGYSQWNKCNPLLRVCFPISQCTVHPLGSPLKKKNITFSNLSFSPFFKCLTTFPNCRIQTAYLSTGLLVFICGSWLSPKSGVHVSLYAWWPLTHVSIWLSRWRRENAKKSIREWENVRIVTNEKNAAISHYRLF